MQEYTLDEINRMVTDKKIEDFYFVILQKRFISSPQEQNRSTLNASDYIGKFSEVRGELSDADVSLLTRNSCVINSFGVIVKIGDKLFDTKTSSFVDLEKDKVVRFNCAADFYTNQDARPFIVSPEINPHLIDPIAVLLFDDLRAYNDYKDLTYERYDGIDLTEEFVKELGIDSPTRKRTDK